MMFSTCAYHLFLHLLLFLHRSSQTVRECSFLGRKWLRLEFCTTEHNGSRRRRFFPKSHAFSTHSKARFTVGSAATLAAC
ncbi:hypothetical protein EDC01DRAFT_123013 [Geopyxis carbonaria]|nr:hypothetical protein EDC01DRAFT_123013 [Geopyxis carbonaria]